MPAFRNIRRSRRISRQPPRDPSSDEFDLYDLNLMYPDASDPSSSSPASPPDAPLPPDDMGEPEVDPESPLLSPSYPDRPTGQRSSHSRKKKPGHIPRPPNAFMIFRSELWSKEKIKSTVERDHRQISRIAGSLWNDLTDAERAPYRDRAEDAKRAHAKRYPEYKYSPVYRRDKPVKRKAKPDHSDKVLRCQQVAKLMQRGFEGDDLEKEMEKCEVGEDDDYPSDASEYVQGPRRNKARKSPVKKPANVTRRRRLSVASEEIKREYDDEKGFFVVKTEPEPELVIVEDAFATQESSPPQGALPDDCLDDDTDAFVPTSEIPDFYLGEPAVKVDFTDPFAGTSCPPPSVEEAIASLDPLSPASGSGSLSDDFLGSAGDDSHVESSSPDAAFIGLFDVHPNPSLPAHEGLKPDYMAMLSPSNPYFALEDVPGQIFSDPDFLDWMHYDSCS